MHMTICEEVRKPSLLGSLLSYHFAFYFYTLVLQVFAAVVGSAESDCATNKKQVMKWQTSPVSSFLS